MSIGESRTLGAPESHRESHNAPASEVHFEMGEMVSTTKLEKVAILRTEIADLEAMAERLTSGGIPEDDKAVLYFVDQTVEKNAQIERLLKGAAGEASKVVVEALLKQHESDHWIIDAEGEIERKIKVHELTEEIASVERESVLLTETVNMLRDIEAKIEAGNVPVTVATIRVKIADGKGTIESATRASGPRGPRKRSSTEIVMHSSKAPEGEGWLEFPPIPESGIEVSNWAAFLDAQVEAGFILTKDAHKARRFEGDGKSFKAVNWRATLRDKFGLDLVAVPAKEEEAS